MRAFLLLLVVAAVGCGGAAPTAPSATPTVTPQPTPDPPSPPPAPQPPPPPTVAQIAGSWGGTMRALFQGARVGLAIQVTLHQNDRTIIGTWTVTSPGNDIRGDIRGTLAGTGSETRFTGVVTWNSETSTGTGRCFGTADFGGPAVPPVLTWESPRGWDFGATCSDPPTGVVWALVR